MFRESECRMETTDLSDSIGAAIRPAGCALLFCERGFAVVSVNFKRRAMRHGDIAVIFPDTLFVVEAVSRAFRTKYIEMGPALFDESTFSLSSGFFDWVYDNPLLSITEEEGELLEAWHRINGYCMRMSGQKSARMMLKNQMQNLFVTMELELMPEISKKNIKSVSSARRLFNRFCQLLVENCYSQHDVKFYADKLCITPYYLSKITSRTLGVPPKEIIDRQIVMEMKRLLVSTDLSAKEIAELFHFDNTSYMGRYFRRHTGMTPTEFREQ